jgi:hypothetical protein
MSLAKKLRVKYAEVFLTTQHKLWGPMLVRSTSTDRRTSFTRCAPRVQQSNRTAAERVAALCVYCDVIDVR